jgi:hypothetical protein
VLWWTWFVKYHLAEGAFKFIRNTTTLAHGMGTTPKIWVKVPPGRPTE